MGRIRTIKPEFFKHSDLFDLEQETGLPIRLAFAGLWTCCDREGRFKWRPRELKIEILPYDPCDFIEVLKALQSRGFVTSYQVDGEDFGCVPSFLSHQVINIREAKSVIPEPGDGTHVHARAGIDHSFGRESRRIPDEVRETVLARDKSTCVRCRSKEDPTVDHIFPWSIGGNHSVTNLRTLCKSCNCARPVAGQALIDDLAKDGLTFDDMPRMCMHVQARSEGKGTEGNGKEGERPVPPPVSQPPRPIVSPGSNGEFMAANWLGEELGIAFMRSEVPVVAKVIQFEARIRGDTQAGAEFIRDEGVKAQRNGDRVDFFWIKDRKWNAQERDIYAAYLAKGD